MGGSLTIIANIATLFSYCVMISGCGILQIVNNAEEMMHPNYASSYTFGRLLGAPMSRGDVRSEVMDRIGRPNASVDISNQRIDAYLRTETSENEGLSFHAKVGYLLLYDHAERFRHLVTSASKERYDRIRTFVKCCSRHRNSPGTSSAACFPIIAVDLEREMASEGENGVR